MSNPVSRVTKGEERRADILGVARRVLLEGGYHKLSLRQVAASLDISIGNLQYYFPSKDDLVETVISQEIDVSLNIALGAAPDRADQSASVHAVVQAILQHHASEAGRFYAIAEGLALHQPRFARLKSRGYALVLEQVAVMIEDQKPYLDAHRRKALATVVVALIDGASLQVQFGETKAAADAVDVLSAHIAEAIVHLMTHWE